MINQKYKNARENYSDATLIIWIVTNHRLKHNYFKR